MLSCGLHFRAGYDAALLSWHVSAERSFDGWNTNVVALLWCTRVVRRGCNGSLRETNFFQHKERETQRFPQSLVQFANNANFLSFFFFL